MGAALPRIFGSYAAVHDRRVGRGTVGLPSDAETAKGSLIVGESAHHRHEGFEVKVADTIGAEDAFTAAMVHHFLRGSAISLTNEAANRMGSLVASESGAMLSLNS